MSWQWANSIRTPAIDSSDLSFLALQNIPLDQLTSMSVSVCTRCLWLAHCVPPLVAITPQRDAESTLVRIKSQCLFRWKEKHEHSQRTVPLHFCPWISWRVPLQSEESGIPKRSPLKNTFIKALVQRFFHDANVALFLFQSNSSPFSPTVPFFFIWRKKSLQRVKYNGLFIHYCAQRGGGGKSVIPQQWTKRSKKNGQCH